jgi:diaminopimelate epimerase
MHEIPFTKMNGTGNDFILINNMSGAYDAVKQPAFVRAVCRRMLSVGADGLICIEPSRTCDFAWRFFNADGSEAEMCGNGARCAARFAVDQGIAGPELAFETRAGVIRAHVADSTVRVLLSPPGRFETGIRLTVDGVDLDVHCLNTGVPHAVLFVDNLESTPVATLGSAVRYHERFAPQGTNVNFVSHSADNMLDIRTYERGVEGETLACGTGSVAAALIAAALEKISLPAVLRTRSGELLRVCADSPCQPFGDVFLEGTTRKVFYGMMYAEAWEQEPIRHTD